MTVNEYLISSLAWCLRRLSNISLCHLHSGARLPPTATRYISISSLHRSRQIRALSSFTSSCAVAATLVSSVTNEVQVGNKLDLVGLHKTFKFAARAPILFVCPLIFSRNHSFISPSCSSRRSIALPAFRYRYSRYCVDIPVGVHSRDTVPVGEQSCALARLERIEHGNYVIFSFRTHGSFSLKLVVVVNDTWI
ncbi:hypothetical protein BDR07DRAFT_317774 [Suillus spraguei]|nr:hypothetical protein BDR07DRAFT_317774 [Suillus spraguei]